MSRIHKSRVTAFEAGPRWRTWVDKKVGGMKGDWKVEIKDADGKVLKDVTSAIGLKQKLCAF
jgi:DUF2914 family protein